MFICLEFYSKFKSTSRAILYTILIDRPFTRLGIRAYRLIRRLLIGFGEDLTPIDFKITRLKV